MSEPVRYRIFPLDPAAHLFRVTCTVQAPDPAGQCFRLPAWIPGSYMIREFAKNIVELWAECDGRVVACSKIDKSTWRCEPVDGVLVVTCDIYAWDLSVRAAHLDDTHAYFNGTSVFLAAVGQEHSPCVVEIAPPEGAFAHDWRVATTLPRAAGTDEWAFGEYRAADYDELVDHPVEIGDFSHVRFHACGVPHDVVVTGVHRADLDRLAADLEKICSTQIRLFGEPAPMDRYLFMVQVVGDGYGGLEHRASTSLLASRDDLPLASDEQGVVRDAYRTFLGLCSHEYFHSWNVKRIKPAAFVPYDLSRESHTAQLWMFEGFTSYYDDLVLVRSGVISPASYLELVGQNITRVLRTPGRHKQSVAESSFDAWTKFYRQDENAPNALVSYYAKGAIVALALDLEIRRATGGQRSLDDVMRLLWLRHGQAGVGVAEDGVQQVAEEVAGISLESFFAQAVYGTDDLDLAPLLSPMAIEFRLRAAENPSDAGGKPGRDNRGRLSIGAKLGADAAGAKLVHCFDGGAAMRAGLSAGDVIVAIDGLRATAANIDKLLAGRRAGDVIDVHAFRRDELQRRRLVLDAAPQDTCWLAFAGGEPSAAARRWLLGA